MVVLEGEAGDAKAIATEETEKEEAKPPTVLTLESILFRLLSSYFTTQDHKEIAQYTYAFEKCNC